MDEEQSFKNRLKDLSRTAWQRNIITFTDFLDLNELHMAHSFRPEEPGVCLRFFGGYVEAERQMAAFLPDAFSLPESTDRDTADRDLWKGFPIRCLRLYPQAEKYAGTLTHRDYLGAIMHLGIERDKIGDIVVDQKTAYVFCQEKLADFLIRELTRVRNTSQQATLVEEPETMVRPQRKEIRGTVASVRLDSLIALAFSSSRSSMTGLIEGGKVFVNGKMITSNGYEPREGDVISVRGHGKFRFEKTGDRTKKGRRSVVVSLYT